MSIRIYLTGRVALEVAGQVVIDERQLRGKQGRLLFTYLVCERHRPVSRDELATVIWPDQLSASWEGALSSLTSKLGTLLSSDLLQAEKVSLTSLSRQYQIRLPADAWIDLETGASALDRAESAQRGGDNVRVLGPATVAATIARRPFLAGVEGFWPEAQRGKLRRQLLRGLDCICQMQISLGESAAAVETAIELVSLDPYRDLSQRNLMQAYAATSNSVKALNVYHGFRQLLADELGCEPSPETESLYLKLLG